MERPSDVAKAAARLMAEPTTKVALTWPKSFAKEFKIRALELGFKGPAEYARWLHEEDVRRAKGGES